MKARAPTPDVEDSRHLTPFAFAGILAVACAAFASWQFADGGLAFVTSELRKDSALTLEVGSLRRAVAYRARYMEDRRDYWVVALGTEGWTFRRVEVTYSGETPKRLEVK